MSKIEAANIYKVFDRIRQWLEAAQGGMSKEQLLAESGHAGPGATSACPLCQCSIYVIMGLSGPAMTLIRHFNRLIEPSAGHILVDGVDVSSASETNATLKSSVKKKMSMVFQRFGLSIAPCWTTPPTARPCRAWAAPNEKRAPTGWIKWALAGFGKTSIRINRRRHGSAWAWRWPPMPKLKLMDEAFGADPLIRREM